MKLLVALIYEKVRPVNIDTAQLNKLRNFIKNNMKNWAILGQEKGTIKNKKTYENLLKVELASLRKVV